MTNILQSLSKTIHLSLGIAILLFLGLHFFGDGFGEANKRPSHDEPSISGLGFGESND